MPRDPRSARACPARRFGAKGKAGILTARLVWEAAPTMNAHAVYLAIIAILIVVLVYAVARAVRATQLMQDVTKAFGVNDILRVSAPRRAALRQTTVRDLLRARTYSDSQREIDALIARDVSLGEFGPRHKLAEACEHALKGGKRLRAVILMEVARAVSKRRLGNAMRTGEVVECVDPADAALFIEYMHSASLVIDDLPAFDNDSERRGSPSVHALTTPAVAQMAATALVASAFQNICRQIDWIRDSCPEIKNVDRIGTRICSDVSRALGVFGAAGGQFLDTTADALFEQHGPRVVMDAVYKKTYTFFEVAVTTGWLVAGGEIRPLADVRSIGRHLGMAFQLADDIGDMERDAERRQYGKPGVNFANELGRDEAMREMNRNLRAARLNLERLRLWTPLWGEIEHKVRAMCIQPPPATDPEGPAAGGSDSSAVEPEDPSGPAAAPHAADALDVAVQGGEPVQEA